MDHYSTGSLVEIVIDKVDRWNMLDDEAFEQFKIDYSSSDDNPFVFRNEVYRSMYRYPKGAKDIIDQWKKYGKAKANIDWARPMIADDIVIDLDLKLFSDDELLWHAEEYYEAIARFCPTDSFGIYNSGTGLHVHFDKALFNIAPSVHVPKVTKHIAESIERHIKLTMPCNIDKSIYHRSACYRYPGSLNPKTRTHKRLVRGVDKYDTREPLLEYMGVYALAEVKTTMATPIDTHKSYGDYPKVTPCMSKLWELGFKHAKQAHGRHGTVLALASWMSFNNMPKDLAQIAIIQWIEAGNITYDKRDTLRCIDEAYAGKVRFGCHSEILETYCMNHCKLYDRKNTTSSQIY